jgi:hypothetical protein
MEFKHHIQFQELLSIRINHGFYYNNRCNDFSFEMGKETLEILNQYGIIIKEEANRLILILDATKDFNHPCYRGALHLNFKIKNKNPQFLNFTHLPFVSGLQINFEHVSGREWLHPADSVTFDICDETEAEGGISGMIQLILNHDDELFGSSSENKNKILPLRYVINFQERHVFWKYILTGSGKFLEDIENLCIYEKNQKEHIVFHKAIPITLSNGRDGYLFISEKSLPLRERPNHQLGLFLTGTKNTENQLIRSLPCPNPRSVQYDPGTKKFYVQEFITI